MTALEVDPQELASIVERLSDVFGLEPDVVAQVCADVAAAYPMIRVEALARQLLTTGLYPDCPGSLALGYAADKEVWLCGCCGQTFPVEDHVPFHDLPVREVGDPLACGRSVRRWAA